MIQIRNSFLDKINTTKQKSKKFNLLVKINQSGSTSQIGYNAVKLKEIKMNLQVNVDI